jgi:putative transposase
MARGKKHTAEQIVNLLRQVEVFVANEKTLPQACKEAEIVEQTYYRWRKEFGGLKVDQARRLKELEQENAKLKRLGQLHPVWTFPMSDKAYVSTRQVPPVLEAISGGTSC